MTVALVLLFVVLVLLVVLSVRINKRRIAKRYGDEGLDAPRPWLTDPKFDPRNSSRVTAENVGGFGSTEATG